jgi:hypothetical protein
METTIICSICPLKFKNTDISTCRINITPSCDHVICNLCVYKFLAYNLQNINEIDDFKNKICLRCIKCDKGKKYMSIPEIYDFINNPTISTNSNSINIYQDSSFLYADKNKFLICKQENHSKPYEFFCYDCKVILCSTCLDQHQNLPQNFHHSVTDDSKMLESFKMCPFHNECSLELHCQTCNYPICFKCRRKKHSEHITIPAKEFYNGVCEYLKTKKSIIENNYKDPRSNSISTKESFSLSEFTIEEIESNSDIVLKNIDMLIGNLNTLKSFIKDKIDSSKTELNMLEKINEKVSSNLK